jgi:hypothetical protein
MEDFIIFFMLVRDGARTLQQRTALGLVAHTGPGFFSGGFFPDGLLLADDLSELIGLAQPGPGVFAARSGRHARAGLPVGSF